jgi:hypothetical protein
MSRSTRACLTASSALSALLLVCACSAAPALGAGAIHFQRESLPALKEQLRHREVHALTFHPVPAPGHIHVSLNDGGHMTVAYASSEQAQLLALARADGTPVTLAVARPKAAKKAVHHKLRYIAGGLVIVVIIVVAAVLLVDRRRKLGEAGGGAPATPSSPDA